MSLISKFDVGQDCTPQAFKSLRHGKVRAGQKIVKMLFRVVPAKAGTHNHKRMFLRRLGPQRVQQQATAFMGPGLRRDDSRKTT
jgi:hypothetical protein